MSTCADNTKRKIIKFELLIFFVMMTWSLILVLKKLIGGTIPVCFYQIFYHSNFLLSKILQAISLKPQPLRSVWNIRTTQRFLAINNTYSLTSNVFLEIVQNLDNNALSASICSCEKKFLSTWSMFWWTKAHLLINGSTVSLDQFALSLNLGILIVFTVTQQKKKIGNRPLMVQWKKPRKWSFIKD